MEGQTTLHSYAAILVQKYPNFYLILIIPLYSDKLFFDDNFYANGYGIPSNEHAYTDQHLKQTLNTLVCKT